jgi:4-aminobutyrate aminotransferase-like enzyme/Ser/Thr protein kinase RdoA (MazF antagonist)
VFDGRAPGREALEVAMGSIVQNAPQFSENDAVRLARKIYDTRAAARPLPSERDQNFHLATDSGKHFVLKIANSGEARETLEFQNLAMQHVVGSTGGGATVGDGACPRVLATADGHEIATTTASDGTRHFVRMLTYLPGVTLASFRPHRPELLRSLGRFFGRLDRRLASFDHPSVHRDFHWDLKNGGRVVRRHRELITDAPRRSLVDRFLHRFETDVEPIWSELRHGVIHNDGNDYNVLVRTDDPWAAEVTGVIDFGDMVYSCIVSELAIVTAYAMLAKANPLAAAGQVVAGYHGEYPLSERELDVVFPLACMRLCMSVCLAAHQRADAPDNEYLSISEAPAWALLERLAAVEPRFAWYALRHACDMAPCPAAATVVRWLRENRQACKSVVQPSLAETDVDVLDLSVSGADWVSGSAARSSGSPEFEGGVRRRGPTEDAGSRIGIGRYDEPRRIYTSPQFAAASDELPERRTIHLGIDLFLSPGEPVFAPLAGVIHSFHDNDAPLDYGPTILVEHRPDDCEATFYTLYGHLSRESLVGLQPGNPVAAGQRIGTIGDAGVNGGWAPHLHFQLICDLLEMSGNFTGVAAPSEREVWLSICPDANEILAINDERLAVRGREPGEILAARRLHLAPSLSVSYRRPLKIVRGAGQYLYDDLGRAYLDAVNNVCHVGHCHPRVVHAGQAQMSVLNTNTRYLHDELIDYIERLCATMPEPLSVCFLVCSGSEANELALRLARAHTGGRDVITVDGAYHGNTQALVDISPYKFDGPGGAGAPSWVHTVVMPDGYRGPYKGHAAPTGERYARHVAGAVDAIRDAGGELSAFICESVLGCGGQVVLPDDYLCQAYDHVRGAGGVCIADEVQVGFGRVGSHFWAFETQGVVPDIVTLGKPSGNGHPLAAVVTTPEIARSFAGGMEYFNTFGGNPVSCAIGRAVLDVIEEEQLQQHAARVGARLKAGLEELQSKYTLIGDVRGMGLFVGVELVLDRRTLAPAAEQAAYIVERMKDHGILIGVDGPLRNVLKIKPPLVFDDDNAADLVRTLGKILDESYLRRKKGHSALS